jgi:Protein of unknown function (DUF3465)
MKTILALLAVAAALYFGYGQYSGHRPSNTQTFSPTVEAAQVDAIQAAFKNQSKGLQVQGEGEVITLLPVDNEGSRHQRFIIKLISSQTLLVSHNIDLAPRINSLKLGDSIAFNGVYEWNPKGGVVHWTHHDPANKHEPGWIKHQARTYQ